ncbi:farnesylcysteine lyase [Amaranthus tricolor]|uniref:farnesylcysteine lyase n=1 Tax=Amaranthus tricolor TaxID=29722 RepID=UPI002590F459|nr:farnesylcysteine lyase [Amaranthus tricolor]XP_057550338.1 farnesylcysteine lyase [Amaranthus tricolor]
MKSPLLLPIFFSFILLPPFSLSSPPPPSTVCIIGSGISGSSVAHFLRKYSPEPSPISTIHIFERNHVVGGRMATVTVANHTFEAGASIIHPKNYHTSNYTEYLNLKKKFPGGDDDDSSLGIWDGNKFVFKTWTGFGFNWGFSFFNKVVSLVNDFKFFWRYGFSLLRMQNFVEDMLGNFLKYYEGLDTRPVFNDVEGMLKWSGLYNLTRRTLEDELIDAGLSPILIKELVTVITRINYGQSVSMSGLAGAVSLAGSGGGFWAVEGGNWQMAAGLISKSDVNLHLNEEIQSVSHLGNDYELNSTKGNSYKCQVTVFSTPLDELDVAFDPPISIPQRKMQHTHTTFIRGLLNHRYFGLTRVEEIPDLVGTLEDSDIPFSCISVLKKHNKEEMTYKMFSRKPLDDALLDQLFSIRKETIRINWAAYPHYEAPEAFAPFILDDLHLYYVNAFESAASAMETGAVSGENIARLILSRLAAEQYSTLPMKSATFSSISDYQHSDL